MSDDNFDRGYIQARIEFLEENIKEIKADLSSVKTTVVRIVAYGTSFVLLSQVAFILYQVMRTK